MVPKLNFHTSLEYAALNLELKRPRTAARHLRVALNIVFRLEAGGGKFPDESYYWFIRSLHALSRAHYLRASGALKEALDRVPEQDHNNSYLVNRLRKLEQSLQACDLTRAARVLRATNEELLRRRGLSHSDFAVGA